jgi:hypothetical protein
MERLITLLKTIEEDDTIPVKDVVDKVFTYTIIELACELLIDENGNNTRYVDVLRKNGFGVFPVERDSVGWLLGAIRTSKGDIIYG